MSLLSSFIKTTLHFYYTRHKLLAHGDTPVNPSNTPLQYGNNTFGLADIREKIFSPVFMRIYSSPDLSLIDPLSHPEDTSLKYNSWVSWFWRKRRALVLEKKVDLAIELVEAYDPNRVLGGIAAALTVYFVLTITWLAMGGDPGYVAGVMSFVLSILAGE